MTQRTLLAAAAALLVSSPLVAHDFWIEPARYWARAPASVNLSLRVGENFDGRAVPRTEASIARFVTRGPSGVSDVAGFEGRDPAGFLRIGLAGDHFVGYETVGQRIELSADRFTSYLEHEGLEHIIEARRRQGTSDQPGRERFIRCAKTLVRAGDPTVEVTDAPLGLTLEAVLETLPGASGESEDTVVRFLFRDRPLADLLVLGLRQGAEEEPIALRTDAEGRVRAKLLPGTWLVKGLHMIPAPEDDDVDWISYWGSLTFSTDRPK